MELVAELRGRDGQTRSVRVPVPVPVPCPAEQSGPQDWQLSGQLRGVRRGLAELQERVVELLAPLVQEQREAAGGGGARGCAEDEDDEEEDGEDEDEDCMDTNANTEDPPPKRTKVQQP
ncbi:EKC/KEOPS complex subunit GON7 [Caloenas nicobarica]|uniref:EKC/KEOPS complex subunit GON7 n=1 Tax=Caloenas nicobarica TaxID=187106 RepID=UPI0032B75409